MGKQYNKTIKRRRRLAYNERKKNAAAAKGKSTAKSHATAKKPAAAAAPAA